MPKSLKAYICTAVYAGALFSGSALSVECKPILASGIFDEAQSLEQQFSYDLAKRHVCETKSVSVGQWDAKASEQFCESNFEQYVSSSDIRKYSKQASAVIANAWTTCVQSVAGGITHMIKTTDDPNQFIYQIRYDAIGAEIDTTVSWGLSNAKCTPELSNNTVISNDSTRSYICLRDPADPCTVPAIVISSATAGSKNVDFVQLPPHREWTFPTPPSIASRVVAGEAFSVTLSYARPTLTRATYRVRYVDGNYFVKGPRDGDGQIVEHPYPNGSPGAGIFNLWGREYRWAPQANGKITVFDMEANRNAGTMAFERPNKVDPPAIAGCPR